MITRLEPIVPGPAVENGRRLMKSGARANITESSGLAGWVRFCLLTHNWEVRFG